MPKPTTLERFLAKIEIDLTKFHDGTPCWNWKGRIHKIGYGYFRVCGKHSSPHQFAYRHFKGPIPKGLQIDHLCRNRACANPEHLEAVTFAENMRRKRKSHCKYGHLRVAGPNGRMRCRPCLYQAYKRFHKAHPEVKWYKNRRNCQEEGEQPK